MADGDSEIIFSAPNQETRVTNHDVEATTNTVLEDLGDRERQRTPSTQGFSSTPFQREAMGSGDNRPIANMVVKPERYDKKGDWAEFISHFSDCAALGNWDDGTKCLILAANLHATARKYYTGLPTEDKRDYGRLVAALRKRFGGEHRQDSWLYKLEMRKRKPGESAADLGDGIWSMSQKA